MATFYYYYCAYNANQESIIHQKCKQESMTSLDFVYKRKMHKRHVKCFKEKLGTTGKSLQTSSWKIRVCIVTRKITFQSCHLSLFIKLCSELLFLLLFSCMHAHACLLPKITNCKCKSIVVSFLNLYFCIHDLDYQKNLSIQLNGMCPQATSVSCIFYFIALCHLMNFHVTKPKNHDIQVYVYLYIE